MDLDILQINLNFLDEKNKLKTNILKKLETENSFMVFGFTSIIWEYFVKQLIKKNFKIKKNN